jgi:hypothetical protein
MYRPENLNPRKSSYRFCRHLATTSIGTVNELHFIPFIILSIKMKLCIRCSDIYVTLCDSLKGGKSPASLKLLTKGGWSLSRS